MNGLSAGEKIQKKFIGNEEWNKPNTPQGKSYRSPSSWTIYNDSTDLFPSIYPGGKTIRDMNGNILDCDADGNCYE